MRGDAERRDKVQRAPAARLAQEFRQHPGDDECPERKQQDRMRRAAVIHQVFDRADERDDEIHVRERAGEEARSDPSRQRAWWRVARCSGARKKRSRQRVGESVH